MRIVAIETSCDETAVCVLGATGEFGPDFRFAVLGNALLSQAELHSQYGGVFPNLAKREHAKNLAPLLELALKNAGMLHATQFDISNSEEEVRNILAREPDMCDALLDFLARHAKPDVDGIAVTYGPGLEPALWMGVNFARALAVAWQVPLIPVNHMEGHLTVAMMEHSHILKNMRMSGILSGGVRFPVLALLISGGHTELVLAKQFGAYELLGATRDDAVGEAFDKVARLMGLPYPGGPEISRLAAEARGRKLTADFKLPRPMLRDDTLNFSFAGLKTAVRKVVEAHQPLSEETRMRIAREFEDAVTEVLVEKTLRAVEEHDVNTLVVGGGVSANAHIRQCLAESLVEAGYTTKLLAPPPELSTDNAIMIGLAGYFRALQKEFADPATLHPNANLRLSKTA
jgi:N6-L-threonylcarbamoyladenine synthase